jgi:hypothetical protein
VIVGAAAALSLAAVVIARTWGGTISEAAGSTDTVTRVSVPAAFAGADKGMSFPVANAGRLLVFRRTLRAPGDLALKVRAIQTGREWTSAFWIPGASAIRIRAGALTMDGHALVAGLSATTPAGAGRLNELRPPDESPTESDGLNRDVRAFAAEIDDSGHVLKTIDFGTYDVQRLCASDDGTFWTIGRDWTLEQEAEVPTTYHLVRQYSARGEMLNQFLPWHWLGQSPSHDDANGPPFRRSMAFLACGKRSIVAYLAKAGAQGFLVAEFDRASGRTRWRHAVRVPGLVMTGLAVLEDKSVHATFATPVRSRPDGRAALLQRGGDPEGDAHSPPGLYALDQNSRPAVWHPVALAQPGNGADVLIGTDSTRLLVAWRADLGGFSPRVPTTPVMSTR